MSDFVKFPRIPHLPWSPGRSRDDLALADTRAFKGAEVVITEKMDGECTTMYRDAIHARSTDSLDHPSRHWVKALHGRIAHDIPEGWRLCGENCFARHSIAYDRLPSYFLTFAAFDDTAGMCIGWDETVAFAHRTGLATVPVLWRGVWDAIRIREASWWQPQAGLRSEGFVVRLARAFPTDAFERSVAKFVRPGHVQTDEHWLEQPVVRNGLATGHMPGRR